MAVAPHEFERVISAGSHLLGLNGLGDCIEVENALAGPFVDACGTGAFAAQVFERKFKSRSVTPLELHQAGLAMSSDFGGIDRHIGLDSVG